MSKMISLFPIFDEKNKIAAEQKCVSNLKINFKKILSYLLMAMTVVYEMMSIFHV